MSSRFCAVAQAPLAHKAGADVILPCQYCDVSTGYGLSGEQRLMLALLADALNVYQKGAVSRLTRLRRLYVDAEQWMLAERAEGNGISFTTVCDALGIDPGLLRRRIITWKHAVYRQRGADQSLRMRLKITPREQYSHRRRSCPISSAV